MSRLFHCFGQRDAAVCGFSQIAGSQPVRRKLPRLKPRHLRPLGTQRVALCASRSYAEARGVPENIEGLSHHDVIAQSSNGRPRPWQVWQLDGALIDWRPKARLLLDGSPLILLAIMAGQDVGLLPLWLVCDDIASGELVVVLEDHVAGHLPVHAIWPMSSVMLPRLRVTIDALVDITRRRLGDGTLA